MTLHIVDDKLLVELPLKMLNRDMMLMSSVAEITDHTDSYVGLSPLRPLVRLPPASTGRARIPPRPPASAKSRSR